MSPRQLHAGAHSGRGQLPQRHGRFWYECGEIWVRECRAETEARGESGPERDQRAISQQNTDIVDAATGYRGREPTSRVGALVDAQEIAA